jgi:hypothetical protein
MATISSYTARGALMPDAFYHGSNDHLHVGTILQGRPGLYEENWSHNDFYAPLERWRPENFLAHRDAVFMVGTLEDVDLAGGGGIWIFEIDPLGPVSRHDLNWSSEVSCLIGDGHDSESPAVREAALNYWNGVPHPNESVWEYICAEARIIRVEPYDDFEPISITGARRPS